MSRLPESLSYLNSLFNTNLYHKCFPGDLYYLRDPTTNVYFLVDTGIAVNVIRQEELEQNYPEAFASRIPIKQPLQGVGGLIYVDAMTTLPFSRHCDGTTREMPFCTGPDVPLNVIGNEWLPECNEGMLQWKRLHPSELPNLTHSEEVHTIVSLINSLTTEKPYELAACVPQEDRNALLAALNDARASALSPETPDKGEPDLLDDPSNTFIMRDEWQQVYRPYSKTLEDLRGNLRAPSKLTFKCTVKLKDPNVMPHVARQYTLPPAQKAALEENIQNLLDLGIIEHGDSDWKCSLFVVPQKVNEAQKQEKGWVQTWRVVHDQKPLNVHVLPEEDTLPRIPEIFAIAQGKSVFSLVDLKKAFFNCDVAEAAQKYFGIPHPELQLRMRKMPMGYKNGPAIWQRIMNHDVLTPVRKRFASRLNISLAEATNCIVAYIDDIFLATNDKASHLALLDILFARLAELRITVNINKSVIGKKSIQLLGSTLNGRTREVTSDRIIALQKLPSPRTIAQLRQFIGAIRYIADHLPDLGRRLALFNPLTGGVPATKAPYVTLPWTRPLLQAYFDLKQLLTDPKTLFQISTDCTLYLETDACNVGFGAFLFQTPTPLPEAQPVGEDFALNDIQPIAYQAGTWTTPAQKNAAPMHKEMLALRKAVEKWSDILLVQPFFIITDNIAVYHLVKNPKGTRKHNPVIERALCIILYYNVKGIYHRGTGAVFTSDALSQMMEQELDIEESDPMMLSVPIQKLKKQENALLKEIVIHCRHVPCSNGPNHPFNECIEPLLPGITEDELRPIVDNEPRLRWTDQGLTCLYGHTMGIPPCQFYEPYIGPNIKLQHWTTLSALHSIFRFGLSPMHRRYIHVTHHTSKQNHKRTEVMFIFSGDLKRTHIPLFKVIDTDVYLIPNVIPPHLLRYEH